MKTIKIGQINFYVNEYWGDCGKYRFINLCNFYNTLSDKYKYEYCDCLSEECDIVFYSLYNDIKRLKLCKGNPLFIYWTDELSCIGYNEIWDNPFNFYKQNNLSISFYDDSTDNCYFPYGIIYYDDIIDTKLNYIKQNFNKDKFCTFCAGNDSTYEAQYRTNIVKYISKNYKQITCCGRVLNNTNGEYLSWDYNEARKYHNNYKFNLCFENEHSTGNCKYITEKICKAYAYNTIPIYWGSDYIENIFNKDSFINCNGLSEDEILNKIIEVDNNNELYEYMINQYPFNYKTINYLNYYRERTLKFIENNI